MGQRIQQRVEREINEQMKNPEQFEDYAGAQQETDIYELSYIRCIAEVEDLDEEGKPTYFTDVAKFWKDPYNGKYMKKYCEVKVLHWYDEDNFNQIG